MEGFADAALAIAFTLPVVELHLPESGDVGASLRALWPSYAGFALASGVIGLNWLRHHFSGAIYRTVGHWFNLATLLFLAAVVFISFPARVLADNLVDPANFPSAARFFMLAMAAITITWSLKWTVGRVMGDVDDRLDPAYVAGLNASYLVTTGLMVAAAALTFVLPWTGLAIGLLITLTYMIPPRTPIYREQAPDVEGEG